MILSGLVKSRKVVSYNPSVNANQGRVATPLRGEKGLQDGLILQIIGLNL